MLNPVLQMLGAMSNFILTLIKKTCCCLNAIQWVWELEKRQVSCSRVLVSVEIGQCFLSFRLYGNTLKICHPKHPQNIFMLPKWGQRLKAFKKWHYQKKHVHKALDTSRAHTVGSDLDHSMLFQKSWQQQLSWRQIKRNCALPNVF